MNFFVNSGISAAPNVPQLMIIDKTSHKLSGIDLPRRMQLIENVIRIDKTDVIHTRFVKGASKSNFAAFEYLIFVNAPLIQ